MDNKTNIYALMERYVKAEAYFDNQNIILEEKVKHMGRFMQLVRELEELTKELDYEELEKLYQEVQHG